MSVSPNPVKDKFLSVRLGGQAAGRFEVRILNVTGQEIYTNAILHGGGDFNHPVNLPYRLPAGVYQLQMILPGNTVKAQKLVIAAGE